MLILLLGSSGYIGSAFAKEMADRSLPFFSVRHSDIDEFRKAHRLLKTCQPDLVINCAAYIPKESVSLCDTHKSETIQGNVLFPSAISNAANDLGIPFAHVSTGCLWSDGLIHEENDDPQRAFNGHCGFYIGTKLLAEQEVRKTEKHYIWRVRLPFDHIDSDRNYISKLANYVGVWDQTNSIAHRSDFAKACLDLWKLNAPYGTYHCTNRGSISVRDILNEMVSRKIIGFIPNILDVKEGACQLSVNKALSAGVKIRSCEEAVTESLNNWVPKHR